MTARPAILLAVILSLSGCGVVPAVGGDRGVEHVVARRWGEWRVS